VVGREYAEVENEMELSTSDDDEGVFILYYHFNYVYLTPHYEVLIVLTIHLT
jgi:hypothetical protein